MTQHPLQPSIECPHSELRPGAQGIERVAVDEAHAQLIVTFYRPITLPQQSYLLRPQSYSLTGGQRLFPHVLNAELYLPTSPPDLGGRRVLLTLDETGDFSLYTLTVTGPGIDPFFSSHKLRFRLACDDPFDCRPAAAETAPAPELPVVIDYLAKDYASFRQALLDFIPTRLPAWTERSEADIGMMLLELFAATADNLSYLQDRVANEAFLSSATQRRSVAAHLALVGYEMDEGASAYTWLYFEVNTPTHLSGKSGLKVTNQPVTAAEPVIVCEPLGEVTLDPKHNKMSLYTWGNANCCLPRQALSAELDGPYEGLEAGQYLLFDDGKGHRDVVRLTARPEIVPVEEIAPPPVTSPPVGSPPAGFVTVVRWSEATPLHFDYCGADVRVRGNLVLATHGETFEETLREHTDAPAGLSSTGPAAPSGRRLPRLRLRLSRAPLAYLDQGTLTLAAPLVPDPSEAAPGSIPFLTRVPRAVSSLRIWVDGVEWQQQPSLLESRPDARVFRVEVDDEGYATVVFGDNTFGLRPPETAEIKAIYRVGRGTIGNVAPDTLTVPQPMEPSPWLKSLTNPVPAVGGRDPESREHARRVGTATFRKPLVAVTTADYQAAAQGFTRASGQQPIQRANAAFDWTGSWLTVTLAVDPRGSEGLTPGLRRELMDYLGGARRLAGYDLEITRAVYVPIELAIEFCVAHGFLAGSVQQALQEALSNADVPDGRRGFFHPDNFSFGDNLYASKIYAAIMSVPGVESAEITRLARMHTAHPDSDTATNLRQGFLRVGPGEIIQLDNDHNFRENGILTIRPKGLNR